MNERQKQLVAVVGLVLIAVALGVKFGQIPLGDNFGGGLSKWEIVSGNWLIEDGKLFGESSEAGIIVFKEDVGVDYEVSCKVFFVASDEAQIVVRYESVGEHYFAGIGAWSYTAAIGSRGSATWGLLSSSDTYSRDTITTGVWYGLKVRVVGNKISVFVDDQEVVSVENSAHTTGQVGLRTYGSTVYFDDFVVRKL